MDHYLIVSSIAVFVESRLQHGFDYSELEKAVGFSLPHIRAVYSRLTGRSLSRYILSRRIANAAFELVHSKSTILDIATKYGFSNPDTFTRAFRRVTGVNPNEFRKLKRPVGRSLLSTGVYGVSLKPVGYHQNESERVVDMGINGHKKTTDGSVVLYGVPKVFYGAYGGVTPLPICVKAVANYMGIDLDYSEAIVNCGAAFRFTWNEKYWDGGNVDAIFAFDDPSKLYRCAIESLGYEFNMLGRSQSTKKSEFMEFIKARIDRGIPVIALGVIGPPEAGIITGYRDNGNTLLGWNLFQEVPEYAATVGFDESGYYVTDKWWENRDTVAVMSLGEATGKKISLKTVVENAIEVMTPRRTGDHAKGGYAYDAWKRAILDESQFGNDMIRPLLAERIMCQADAMDCLADGRNNAYEYFRKLADESREQPLFGQIAEQFGEVKTCAIKMYQILGGWERGEKQMQALAERENRVEIGKLIDKCKAADEKALDLLHKLLQSL